MGGGQTPSARAQEGFPEEVVSVEVWSLPALSRSRSGRAGGRSRRGVAWALLHSSACGSVGLGSGGWAGERSSSWWSRQERWQEERGGSRWDVSQRWAEELRDAKIRRARQRRFWRDGGCAVLELKWKSELD